MEAGTRYDLIRPASVKYFYPFKTDWRKALFYLCTMLTARPNSNRILHRLIGLFSAWALVWTLAQASVHTAYHAFESHEHEVCPQQDVHLHAGDESPCWLDFDAIGSLGVAPLPPVACPQPQTSFASCAVPALVLEDLPVSSLRDASSPRGPPACTKA